MVTAWGRDERGITVNERIYRHEVEEFVTSCVNAGWERVAVTDGLTLLAAFNERGVWVHDELKQAS